MDLRKAFDTVDHDALFTALGHHGVEPNYIVLLKKLYGTQIGRLGQSRNFSIIRGVRQVIY